MTAEESQFDNSYESILKVAKIHARLEAEDIKWRGYGGIMSIFSEQGEVKEREEVINIVQDELGISTERVEYINIADIVSAIKIFSNTGMLLKSLEIDEIEIEQQTLQENVFQYVYRNFGNDRGGWRIGESGTIDSFTTLLEEITDADEQLFQQTPFAYFIKNLDITLPDGIKNEQNLIVLHHPSLDQLRPIRQVNDAMFLHLPEAERKIIDDYLQIYRLITQVYPGRFINDNPANHVLVNIFDNSFVWYTARNIGLSNNYIHIHESFWNRIELPGAKHRYNQLASRIFED